MHSTDQTGNRLIATNKIKSLRRQKADFATLLSKNKTPTNNIIIQNAGHNHGSLEPLEELAQPVLLVPRQACSPKASSASKLGDYSHKIWRHFDQGCALQMQNNFCASNIALNLAVGSGQVLGPVRLFKAKILNSIDRYQHLRTTQGPFRHRV